MANEGQEQKPAETEGKDSLALENPLYSSTGGDEVSKGKEATLGDDGKGTDTEDKKAEPSEADLERKIQSAADKRMKPLEAKIRERDEALTKLTKEKQDAEARASYHARQLDEAKAWSVPDDEENPQADPKTIRTFQQAQDGLVQAVKTYVDAGILVTENGVLNDGPRVVSTENRQSVMDDFIAVLGESNLEKVTLADLKEMQEEYAECKSANDRKYASRYVRKLIKDKYEKLIEKPAPPAKKEEDGKKQPDSGRPSGLAAKKGYSPTLEEIQGATAEEYRKKINSGEWVVRGAMKKK